MYLLVLITLVISITGLYAQVLSLEASRLAQQQTAVAQAMLTWHATAVAQARYARILPPTAAGCSLTAGGPAGVPPCQDASGNLITVSLTPSGSDPFDGTTCSGPPAAPCWTVLPPGYLAPPYVFYSIYYRPAASTQNYVITFVPPPITGTTNPPPGMITLPGNGTGATELGITLSEFYQQLKNTGIMPASYGLTSGTNLITATISDGTGPNVTLGNTLPTSYTFTNGTVAVISIP